MFEEKEIRTEDKPGGKEMVGADERIIQGVIFHDIIQMEEEIEFAADLNSIREELLMRIRRVAYLVIDEG